MRSPPFAGIFDSWPYERKAEGERVLIIGDFLYRNGLEGFLCAVTPPASLVAPRGCTFDWRVVARFYPTLVILAPTQRTLACDRNTWPIGLAGP